MVEENLRLGLPKSFKWLDVKIVDPTRGSKTLAEITEDNIITIKLGLFRKNEFIRLQALADIPQIKNDNRQAHKVLTDELKIEHRIADTNIVRQREIDLGISGWRKNIKFQDIILPIISVLLFFMILFTTPKNLEISEFTYGIKVDSTIIQLRAKPHMDNTVELVKTNGDKFKTVSLSEFNNTYKKLIIQKSKLNDFSENTFYFLISLSTGLMIISIFLFLFPLMKYREIKKIRKTLDLE